MPELTFHLPLLPFNFNLVPWRIGVYYVISTLFFIPPPPPPLSQKIALKIKNILVIDASPLSQKIALKIKNILVIDASLGVPPKESIQPGN